MNRYDKRVYALIVRRDNRLAKISWVIFVLAIMGLAIALSPLWLPKAAKLLQFLKQEPIFYLLPLAGIGATVCIIKSYRLSRTCNLFQ